jgi:hypothetical protein
MYCPRCGQEQLSAEVRFCSRCGFSLQPVTHLLVTGALPASLGEPVGGRSPRQNGMRMGAKLLFASIVLFPIAFAFAVMVDGPGPLLMSVLPFFAGVCRMLYARMFEDGAMRPEMQPAFLEVPPRGAALPPYQPPVPVIRQGRTTGELVEPPSVTEHTTRLLDK